MCGKVLKCGQNADNVRDGEKRRTYQKRGKGGYVTTGKPPDREYATAEEIGEAVESLTEVELGRIHRAAQYALFGTEYTDPLELLGEAVQRTLEGVGVKEGRHWPKGVHFVAYLIRTMQSICSPLEVRNQPAALCRLDAPRPVRAFFCLVPGMATRYKKRVLVATWWLHDP